MGTIKIVVVAYLVMSVLTFFVYWKDKSAARRGGWRIKESTLHLLALCCGWPGALMAQKTLRHKTQKQPFQVFFWVTVLVNSGFCGWGIYQILI